MDGKKKTASGKTSDKDRVPTLFKDLFEKCKLNNIDTFIMPAILSQKPKPGQVWSTYLLDLGSMSDSSDQAFENMIKIYIAFPHYEKSGPPQKIFIKNTKITANFLNIICSVFEKYDQITTIKLEYCNLSKLAIEILQQNLLKMPNITVVSLDGNPISAQNHGLIAFSNTLEHLSLKRCKINEFGIQTLYENLTKVSQPKLQILNLMGNYINDTGAMTLEKILRENRSINALILSDNWITDTGCFSLMSALQKFSLVHDEITKRRAISIDYFKSKVKMAEEYKKERIIEKPVKVLTPVSAKSETKSKHKSGKSKKQQAKEIRKSTLNVEINKQVSEYVNTLLPKITHPFITETQIIDGEMICNGNFVLGFINLAYNKLTIKGYKYIIDALNYQLSTEFTPIGLSYVVLNGNLDLSSYEFDEIGKLVQEKLWKIEDLNKSVIQTDSSNGINISNVNSVT